MSTSFDWGQSDAVLAEYRSRVGGFQIQLAALEMRKRWAVARTAACVVFGAALFIAGPHEAGLRFAVGAIALLGAMWGLRTYLRWRGQALDLAHRTDFYERGIDRMEGKWRGQGRGGMEFAREHHLCQEDLDILGEGSLFELMATTRSEIGAERLADFLLEPPTLEEARSRQAAVKELRGAAQLREEIVVLGRYQFQNCRRERFRAWLDLPILKVSCEVQTVLFFSGAASLLLGLAGFAGLLHWLQIARVFIPLLVVQAGISLPLMERVRARIKILLLIGGDVTVLHAGIELMEGQQFHSEKLCCLIDLLRAGGAAGSIQKLERLLIAIERREDITLYGFSLWLAAGTQLVLAVERWREEHGAIFENWLDAWAKFEALNALGCYAWEHPEYEFPELLEGGGCFEAEGLGHPLLPRDGCVGNEVGLNAKAAFYLISGSNMAGKSTFLRAMGMNAVLAATGAPVRARSARLSVFHVCASISIADSMQEGKSKFMAEVERLRESIAVAQEGRPVLFLIDEVLSGTNSRDRKIASVALIEALVARGAVGALSTHDLALTEIAEKPFLRGVNVHMESETPEQPLDFDYRVKPGVARQTNALAIVKMMGIAI